MVLFLIDFGNLLHPNNGVRVACVGDSITEGVGYPAELQFELGNSYLVRNFGVGGASVMVESGKPYVEQFAFQEAKDFLPEIIVIMLGTNDARLSSIPYIGEFTVEYEEIINAFQEITSNPRVCLVKPPPIFENELGLNGTILVRDLIPSIERLANDFDLSLIDVYSALIDHPEHFVEGVHPTIEGAQIIAKEVSKAITSRNSKI
jgi:lysophospholipase L1-like esterase